MSFSALTIAITSLGYLTLLFAVAWMTERGRIPGHWVRHPLMYTLSLGVFAGIWAVYGAVGMAGQFGFGYLAYYIGLSGAFLLAPVLLSPILRVSRAYQLTSLADLFAFRYRSQFAGTLVTLISGAATLALLSMQIKAVADAAAHLAPDLSPKFAAVLFSLAIILFACLFGARDADSGGTHQGLVAAIAFDSLVKLGALALLAGVLLVTVFGGIDGLNEWFRQQSGSTSPFHKPLNDGTWRALMLMSFAAVLVLPHMFHMVFSENPTPRAMAKASWGVPIHMLLLALPVPVIYAAAQSLGVDAPASLYALETSAALDNQWLTLLIYVAGLSAASGLMIVSTLALSGMLLHHVVLPIYPPRERSDIYGWLRWIRRMLIAVIILGALLFHEWIGIHLSLGTLGIIALAGVLQCLPGALGIIYWPEGTRTGLVAGLISGTAIWIVTLVIPFSIDTNLLVGFDLPATTVDQAHIYLFVSLTVNVLVFGGVSMVGRITPEEESAAQACSMGALSRPHRRELLAGSSDEFRNQLSIPLGTDVARREVDRALAALRLPPVEYRPYQLRRLRDQIEVNLSGLLGPSVSADIVKSYLGFKPQAGRDPAQDIHYIEKTLGEYQTQLTGLAGELDNLRRHYRQTLQNLPIAACSIGDDGEILMWNHAMQQVTGIDADDVVGGRLLTLPEKWRDLLEEFVGVAELHRYKHRLDIRGRPHWFNLHKSTLSGPEHPEGGNIILVEDQTETRILEDELIHSERLASVGRLAAGVAHEVGNPVTGISSLAQNLKLETDDPDILDSADQIQQQTRRISRILQSLMNFARSGNHAQANRYEPVSIRRCIEESVNLLSLSTKGRELTFEIDCPENLLVLGDEQRLEQVFVNLLANARDASPDGARICISGKREAYSAIIEVLDQGQGIGEDQLDHIFEPFYTTKGPNQGTGLGLSLVYSIVEEHYGHIQAESPGPDGWGTCFRVRLPAYEPDETDNESPV